MTAYGSSDVAAQACMLRQDQDARFGATAFKSKLGHDHNGEITIGISPHDHEREERLLGAKICFCFLLHSPPLPTFNKLLNCSNSHDEQEGQTRYWFVASSQKGTYVMRCLVLINDLSNAPMLALKKSRLMAAESSLEQPLAHPRSLMSHSLTVVLKGTGVT